MQIGSMKPEGKTCVEYVYKMDQFRGGIAKPKQPYISHKSAVHQGIS